jgi:hypothetical protein
MRALRISFVIFLLLSTAAAQQGPCSSSTTCLGLSEGAACNVLNTRTLLLTCGVCTTVGTCTRACIASSDQSACTAAPTCTTVATGTGGIGITSACGTTRVINGDALKAPTEFTSANGLLNLTMSVRIQGWNATAFTLSSRVFCVGYAGSGNETCSVPGPTIRVKPGDRLIVAFTNNLPTDYTSSNAMNTLRQPNYANLHTHGFHVDPTIDNVMIHVAPGESWTYDYAVPSDHLPGTHWYHSHLHGSSALRTHRLPSRCPRRTLRCRRHSSTSCTSRCAHATPPPTRSRTAHTP